MAAVGEHASMQQVDVEAVETERLDAAGGTAQQRPQPRHQLGERERLHQVIVGAALETVDALRHPIACRQDEDRYVVAARAQIGENVVAATAGHHHVEDHGAEAGARDRGERVPRRCRRGDLEPRAGEPGAQRLGRRGIVLEKQNVHAASSDTHRSDRRGGSASGYQADGRRGGREPGPCNMKSA